MEEAGNATITGLERELADASQVIAELTAKLERAGETIKGLKATIAILSHERDRERLAHAKAWDALSNRIARMEEAGDRLYRLVPAGARGDHASDLWRKAKEAQP
jgi:chromosome segregation ATPase